MKTVAEHLVEVLVVAGIRRIYGMVGDSLNSIVEAVHHSKRIKWYTFDMRKPAPLQRMLMHS